SSRLRLLSRSLLLPYTTRFRSRPLPAGLACWQCEGLRAADGTRTRIPRTDGREVAFSAPPSPAGVRYLTSRQRPDAFVRAVTSRSEEHTSELQSRFDLVCRLLL